MKKIVKYFFLFISHVLFMAVSVFVPKDKKLWIFGCWGGQLYADNAKYFYEWIKANKPDIRAIWLTDNDSIIEYLAGRGDEVYRFKSLMAKLLLMKASVIVETEGNRDIGGYRPARCKIIQLWHGVGAKSILWNKKGNAVFEFMKRIIFDDYANDYWMFASEMNKKVMVQLYSIPDNKTFITGYSRDNNLEKQSVGSAVLRLFTEKFPDYKKILYMPTHRNFGLNKTTDFTIQDLAKVNEFLVSNKMVLLYKPHIHELQNFIKYEGELTNIVLAKDQEFYSDVYSYLFGFDALICDYSSVAYDFLCTKKPIVVFAYDLESYKSKEGLFDFFEKQPIGPFCYDWETTLDTLKLMFEEDDWKERRELARKEFHYFDDCMNNERIYSSILSLLTGERNG